LLNKKNNYLQGALALCICKLNSLGIIVSYPVKHTDLLNKIQLLLQIEADAFRLPLIKARPGIVCVM
jgi:hypothetical protein